MPEVSDDVRNKLNAIVDHQFSDSSELLKAITHASIADNRLNSNERLEFLGDSILGAVVCEHLYSAYPDYLEGELTKIKSTVVSRKICAEVSMDLELPQLMIVGKGMAGRQQLPLSLAAAVYESVIGALFLDAGFDKARAFVLRTMAEPIKTAAESAHQQNYKSVLQQHAQKHLSDLPVYVLVSETGPDHAKQFEVSVEIGDRKYPSAWGDSKKTAEQGAALIALRGLGLVTEDADGSVHLVKAPVETADDTEEAKDVAKVQTDAEPDSQVVPVVGEGNILVQPAPTKISGPRVLVGGEPEALPEEPTDSATSDDASADSATSDDASADSATSEDASSDGATSDDSSSDSATNDDSSSDSAMSEDPSTPQGDAEPSQETSAPEPELT